MSREPWKFDLAVERLNVEASGKGAAAPESERIPESLKHRATMMLLRWAFWLTSLVVLSLVFGHVEMITYISASLAAFGKSLMGK